MGQIWKLNLKWNEYDDAMLMTRKVLQMLAAPADRATKPNQGYHSDLDSCKISAVIKYKKNKRLFTPKTIY